MEVEHKLDQDLNQLLKRMEENVLAYHPKKDLVAHNIAPLIVNGEDGRNIQHVLKVVEVEPKLDQDLNQLLKRMGENVQGYQLKQNPAISKTVFRDH